MRLEEVIEKLRTLGVFPNTIRENAEIFGRCENLDNLKPDVIKNYSGCGTSQFVHIHLAALLKQNPDYKTQFLEKSKKALGELGIQSEHIVEYFQSGESPNLIFNLDHSEKYDTGVRMKFYQRADQFALDELRWWLGVKKNSN